MRIFFSGIATGFLITMSFFSPEISSAGSEKTPAVAMQEHMQTMKKKSPALYRSMVEAAGGNVTDCISCHRKLESKKSHFRFQTPGPNGKFKQ